MFYEQLVRISPALGTRVGCAAAVAEAEGPEAGLAVLESIDAEAYDRAIGLAEDPAVREFLLQKRG